MAARFAAGADAGDGPAAGRAVCAAPGGAGAATGVCPRGRPALVDTRGLGFPPQLDADGNIWATFQFKADNEQHHDNKISQ